jgi:hypothetical protein
MDWGLRALRRVADLSRQFPPQSAAPAEFRHAFRSMLVAAAKAQGEVPRTAESGTEKVVDGGSRAALVDRTRPTYRPSQSHPGPSLLRAPAPRARAAVLVGVTAGALALSGVSAASTRSLPGDPLYQVKRSSEQAQLALAASDQTRGQLYLEFARSRVLEAREVQPERVASVLADMDHETILAVYLMTSTAVERDDPGVLGPVGAFLTEQRRRLSELRLTLTVAGPEPLLGSARLLDRVEERIRTLSRALVKRCPIAAITDDLGPKPTIC